MTRIFPMFALLLIALPAPGDSAAHRALSGYETLSHALWLGKRELPVSATAMPHRAAGTVSRADLSSIRRPGDADGGIGTAYVNLALGRKVSGPREDFAWHQETLTTWLEDRLRQNQEAAEALQRFREYWATALESGDEIPGGSWLAEALRRLVRAEREGDAALRALWTAELEGALIQHADLHRWTEFLLANQLFALSLQAQTAGLFEQMDALYREKLPYNPNSHVGRFPAGEMTLYHADNYLELERRAETLLSFPEAWPKLLEDAPRFPTLPPELRTDMARLAEGLPEPHRDVLLSALRTPYELSFLASALHKARTAGKMEALATVLARYADLYPEPLLTDMMELLHDRAGGWFCGLEWGDRFHPDLMNTPDDWPRDRVESIWRAHAAARAATRDTQGFVFTLREALESGALDCIRTTDAMAALHRNAGHPGFLMVRLSRGGSGHTIAALRQTNGEIRFLDGQVRDGAPGVWPRDFRDPLRPHPAYSVELFGRGLDSWVFLEGYLVFGPARGNHVSAPVPYLRGYEAPRQRLLD